MKRSWDLYTSAIIYCFNYEYKKVMMSIYVIMSTPCTFGVGAVYIQYCTFVVTTDIHNMLRYPALTTYATRQSMASIRITIHHNRNQKVVL